LPAVSDLQFPCHCHCLRTRRTSARGLRREVVMLTFIRAVALTIMWVTTAPAQEIELYYYDHNNNDALTRQVGELPAIAAGRKPVLFVHGHRSDFASDNDSDTDPNYAMNFIRRLDSLPSFDLAMTRNSNLNIEPYFIRFFDQARSISADAN